MYSQMKAFTYRNNKTAITDWRDIHLTQPLGYAYETDTHFVHLYGREHQLWAISPGLTITDAKSGSLQDWIVNSFGASEIKFTNCDVGETIEGIYRPGLFYDDEMLQGLGETSSELRFTEQALLLLLQRLDELLLFIEPNEQTLDTHSHKARELLILACTEIEAQWKGYLVRSGKNPTGQGFTTNDYIKLLKPLHLDEYEITLPRYEEIGPVRPFLGWSNDPGPTQSLPWFDSYNKTKHDRIANFRKATLRSCIQAVAAAIALFAVRFGPFRLYQGGGTLSAVFNHTFSIQLKDCDAATFYVPEVDVTQRNPSLAWGHANVLPRKPQALVF